MLQLIYDCAKIQENYGMKCIFYEKVEKMLCILKENTNKKKYFWIKY